VVPGLLRLHPESDIARLDVEAGASFYVQKPCSKPRPLLLLVSRAAAVMLQDSKERALSRLML
jgi:hypothetical protein